MLRFAAAVPALTLALGAAITPPGITTAQAGVTRAPAGCHTSYVAVTPGGRLVRSTIDGAGATTVERSVQLTFVPRLMAETTPMHGGGAESKVTTEQFHAVRASDGSLWRITWTSTADGRTNQVTYHRASNQSWGSVRALTDGWHGVYLVDAAGALRYAGVDQAGTVSARSSLLRRGMSDVTSLHHTSTTFMSWDGTNGGGTVISDILHAVTRGGRLVAQSYDDQRTLGWVEPEPVAGWDRFSGLTMGSCQLEPARSADIVTARDRATGTLYSYLVVWKHDRRTFTYVGSPGKAPGYLYG